MPVSVRLRPTHAAVAAAVSGALMALSAPPAAATPAQTARPHASESSNSKQSDVTCRRAPQTVTLHGDKYELYGKLCTPEGKKPDTVQLLLPGGTYSHVYWDFPYKPQRYSYARHMAANGYATLAIDRINMGHRKSRPHNRPVSASINVDDNARVAHQVVQRLRSGALGHYRKIITAGHSYGSITAMVEASRYNDVDGVIITGILHRLEATGTAKIGAYLNRPADTDARRFRKLDPGYLTTNSPAARSDLFYVKANADPNVIRKDEATKDTITATELATFPEVLVNGTTTGNPLRGLKGIRVPVLVAAGQKDAIFCGPLASDCSSGKTVQRQEQPYYLPETCMQSYVLRNSGHDMNLHRNSEDWYSYARKWADRHFGTGPAKPRC
jgi:pimeloyl-ACP methyl ester carboxylesterase